MRASKFKCLAENSVFSANFEELQISTKSKEPDSTQITSYKFKTKIVELGLEHEFTAPSMSNLNAFIEFFSIVTRMKAMGESLNL